MITGTDVYWITRLDNICTILEVFGIFGTMFSVIGVVLGAMWWHEDGKKSGFVAGVLAMILFLTCGIGRAFTPTTKEMCAIIVLPAIINNEDVQGLPSKVVNLANEWLTELKPKKGD